MTAPVNTTFASGTTITSDWLNSVNDHVNNLETIEHTSDKIEFTPAGTGAINRDVQSKLRESVSVKDFGADPTGSTDSTAAAQLATNTGRPVDFSGGTFKISGVTYTGKVVWFSDGSGKILSDDPVLTVTSGTDSIVDNIELENITAPWIITRDPSNWSAVPTPVQSNASGYQPTVNDTDLWGSLTTAQQNQNIGPQIIFEQLATNIRVSNITGEFVSIILKHASKSTVRDCNIRAGKNYGAGILFWNVEHAGYENSAINNTVTDASFSGIAFARNYDGIATGNIVSGAGESGIKTYQNFNTNDFRCYRMLIDNNLTRYCYYDGFDVSSDYPHTGLIESNHHITGNKTYGNKNTGFYGDGKHNSFVGNSAQGCGLSGVVLTYSNSKISDNFVYDCNKDNSAPVNQITIEGDGNQIANNQIIRVVSNGYGLYAPGDNFVYGNVGENCDVFVGNPGSITSIRIGNTGVSVPAQGDFTPYIIGTSVNGTGTYSRQSGKYSVNGNTVSFCLSIIWSAHTGSGAMVIRGLPVAADPGTVFGVVSIFADDLTYPNVLSGYVGPGSVDVNITSSASASTTSPLSMDTSGSLYISGTYFI